VLVAQHVICDGTFLEQRIGIYAIMSADIKQLVYAAYNIPEGGGRLLPVYQALAARGLSPESATVDGNPQQIKYLRCVWPTIKIQRCIVHVQRQGLSWCRRNPKRTDAKHLKNIFLRLCDVKTPPQALRFIADVNAWEHRFGPLIDRSTDRGWVFSDLLRARSMLLKALPDLFHFVGDSRTPSSTNMLESYFSRLKEHYRHHRGLAVHHRDAYFKWYFYLVPGKNSNTK
jgi:transposase-like protein